MSRFLKKPFSLLCLSVFLLLAPWWAFPLQELLHHSFYTTADAFVLLGISGLAAFFCCRFLPDSLFEISDKTGVILSKTKNDKRWLWILAFLAGTFVVLLWINRLILHSFMGSADEHSCYFLAECFRMGKWWLAPHPLSEFFNVVHVGNRDGKWFSVYPPGWPLLMAFGLKYHFLDSLNPAIIAAALFFFFLTAKKLYGTSTAWIAALITTLSPFFLFTAAAYFSHPTCFLTMTFFTFGFLKWKESQGVFQKNAWALAAGSALAYGLITRYLTMACFALPFVILHFWPLLRRKRKIQADDIWFAIPVLLSFVLLLYQNKIISGKLFNAPNHFDKRWEKLGFRSDYTVIDGFFYIIARFFYLMDWAPPALIVGYLLSMFLKQQRSPLEKIFRYSFWTLVLGYFFYYSWGGNQFGPRYYYEGFPFLALEAAFQIHHFWTTQGNKKIQKCLVGLLLTFLPSSGYLFYKQGTFFEEASRQRRSLYDFAETSLSRPSIVFIHGFLGDRLVMSEDDAVRNKPSLDEKILYAHDLSEKNKTLMAFYPNRSYYRGFYDRKKNQPVLELI